MGVLLLLCGCVLSVGGCGTQQVDRPSAGVRERPCILPFQHPSSYAVDRTRDFLGCFESHGDIARIHSILSTWDQRLGKERMSALLLPVTAMVTDPSYFRAVLTKFKDPAFPVQIAPLAQGLQVVLNSSLGKWALSLSQNMLEVFGPELQSWLSQDFRDPRERELWISAGYALLTHIAQTLSRYEEPPEAAARLWKSQERDFWVNLATQTRRPELQSWFARKHEALIDYMAAQYPTYTVFDALFSGYPDSMIQRFANNVWRLKRSGDSGELTQEQFTDYIDTHMDVLFNAQWTLEEIKLILSRSIPITFQLFSVELPDMKELGYIRELVKNVLDLEQTGSLYQFVQFIQVVFDLDQDLFWRVMNGSCDQTPSEQDGIEPSLQLGGSELKCNFFPAVSYLWSYSPIVYTFRHMPPIPNFLKRKLIQAELSTEFKNKLLETLPPIEDPQTWVTDALTLVENLQPTVMKWVKEFASAREDASSQQTPVPDQQVLSDLRRLLSNMSEHPDIDAFVSALTSVMAQPEFTQMLDAIVSFLLSQGAGEIMSRGAVLGERFLGQVPPARSSDESFVSVDIPNISHPQRLDWYDIIPPTVSQLWEIDVVKDSLNHPSAETSWDWTQMGGINTLYFLFLPDYLEREKFNPIEALRWISSLASEFDYPQQLEWIPQRDYVTLIASPFPKEMGAQFRHPEPESSVSLQHPFVIPASSVIPAKAGIHSSYAIGVDPRLRGDDKKGAEDFFGPHIHEPVRRLLWRLSREHPHRANETMLQTLIMRLKERLDHVSNFAQMLSRLVREKSFMPLHPDREMPALREMVSRLSAMASCDNPMEKNNPTCQIKDELQAYERKWSSMGAHTHPYQLIIEEAAPTEPAILEQIEDMLLTGNHPFVFEPDKSGASQEGWLDTLSRAVAGGAAERMAFLMRQVDVRGAFYDDMSMHFLVNFVNNTDGSSGQIYRLVNRTFFDEFTGTASIELSSFVDVKDKYRSGVFEGMGFPSARVLCFEYHVCSFPTDISVMMALTRFSVFGYLAEPMFEGESLFSIFYPFFKDVAEYTAPSHQLAHSWRDNQLAFFSDFARVGGLRLLRPIVAHLHETGELTTAIKLLKIYLSGYQTPEDFADLKQVIALLYEKYPLIERLIRALPHANITPMHVWDAAWMTVLASVEALDGKESITGPQIDRWVAAALAVLDEQTLTLLIEAASALTPMLEGVLGSMRFLRVVGDRHEVLKILTKVFFNMMFLEELSAQKGLEGRSFEEQKTILRAKIAQLPEWIKMLKTISHESAWSPLPHQRPKTDADWILFRSSRLATYLHRMFYPNHN